MLPFKVRRFRARSGEDVVILVRRCGGPFFYPNVFVTSDYRNIGKSPNTAARVLRSVGMALMWAETKCRDLDDDLVDGRFISVQDADDLASFLGLAAADQETKLTASLRPTSEKRAGVVTLEAYRPHPRNLDASQALSVSTEDVGARIRWVAKYAEWHLRRRLHAMEVGGQPAEPFKSNAESAIRRLRNLAPSVSGFIDDDKALESPDVEVIVRIEQILQPNSIDNPFTSDFIQWRNYLAWRLLLDTGGRRAEIHGAKTEDIKYAMRRFEIVRSKTLERTVAIRSKTADAFDHYVMNHWTKLPHNSHARREGYLFCDTKGQHLSLRAINRIFETVRQKLEDRPQKITPHAMRRFWNYLFSKQVDQAPAERRMTNDAEARYRMRIMGWSTDAQAKRYNRRHIMEAGDQVSQKMMDQLDGSANDRSGA